MSDQQKSMTQMLHGSTLGSPKVIRFLIATAIGAALLCLSAITLTQTLIALILAAPFLFIISPVLVPNCALVVLITVGFLFSGCCCVAALAALPLIYKYVAGKPPIGADKIEQARMKIASTGRDMKEMAKEYGQYLKQKAQEATQGS